MNDEIRYAINWIGAAIVTIAVTTLLRCLSADYTERTKAAFAAGMQESTLPGYNGTFWVSTNKFN